MGDRTNPIKFGPEWLRNLAREPSNPGNTGPGRDGASTGLTGAGAAGGGAPTPPQRPANVNPNTNAPPQNTSKVLLAKLRYGREEMLALYDRQTAEAPPQLKAIEALYQARGKPPYALNNIFEDDTRENMRGPAPMGGQGSGDRYPAPGRGRSLSMGDPRGRGLSPGDNRARGRGYNRQTSVGRGNPNWHGNPRNSYSGMPDDDPNQPMRQWGANANPGASGLRPTALDQPDWQQNKQQPYRNKRQTNTNWRQQQSRDEGEEWRSTAAEGTRRPQEKWEWEWNEARGRPNQDKWHSNRRTWEGGHEDALPEWAVENAEACGGTFDSSGAFHGYSHDDANFPKNPEPAYSLTRSNTHGTLLRSKTVEEGSEEWWASEKAKKLSPKRFDASEIQFKKTDSQDNAEDNANTSSASEASSSANGQSTGAIPKSYRALSADKASKDSKSGKKSSKDKNHDNPDSKAAPACTTASEEKQMVEDTAKEKSFEQRSDSAEKLSEDNNNFQSVILTSNNSLRQKHQNYVGSPNDSPQRQVQGNIMKFFDNATQARFDSDDDNQKEKENNKLVDDILQMDVSIPSPTMAQLLASTHGGSAINPLNPLPNSSMQMPMSSPLQGLGLNTQTGQNMQPSQGIQSSGLQGGMMQASQSMQSSGLQSGMMQPTQGMQSSGLQGGMMQPPQGIQSSGLQGGMMQPSQGMQSSGVQGGMMQPMQGMPSSGVQGGMMHPMQGMPSSGMQGGMMQPSQGMPTSGVPGSMMQPIGIPNSMLNASLGLPMPTPSSNMPMQGMPPHLPNPGLSLQGNPSMLASALQGMGGGGNIQPSGLQPGGMQPASMQRGPASGLQAGGMHMPGLQGNGMQHGNPMQNNMQGGGMPNHPLQPGGPRLPGFPPASGMPGISNNSMFNMQNPNNLPNHGGQNLFPMHEMQQAPPQPFNNSVYSSMMSQPPPPLPNMGMQHNMSSDEWFYEDPNKTIQGPFTPKEMFSWFRAGFFSPTLMVSRGCDRVMRPLGSYGQLPFGQLDQLPPYQISGGYDIRQPQDMLSQQPGLGIDVESLWNQPSNNAPGPNENRWNHGMNNGRNENRINNLPMYFWDNQPNMPAPPLLPKDMKTEDEILAQMRAAQQAPKPTTPLSFLAELPAGPTEEGFNAASASLNIDQLQKLIQNEDTAVVATEVNESDQQKLDKAAKIDPPTVDAVVSKPQIKTPEAKSAKEVPKAENKVAKVKDTPAKTKSKAKDEMKKEQYTEAKTKDEEVKIEKRSAEPSPSPKNKKDDKTKKDLEKEKKEWIKEGFTIVKGAEKNKENKKKTDEAKGAEETDRKRKEDDKPVAEEKKRQADYVKKLPDPLLEHQYTAQRHSTESVSRRAPWSASSHEMRSSNWDGPTLAEIQRLEREKKLEQMKEQQHMMHIIASQQAAALARDQEMATGLGWAKKSNSTTPNQTLAEIQAEARAQAAAAAAAQLIITSRDETLLTPPLISLPWGSSAGSLAHNGAAGFWDCPLEPIKPIAKPSEAPKPIEPRPKKKVTVMAPPKPENTPALEFELWCTNMLYSWRDTSIDIPTFVGFLRDIESPYEVRDYVKCYLGESREASDFASQFLERRSRLLRVGMVTPSDDLCSPAVAINPRTNSGSDFTEVKGKGKKTKKNKMLKVLELQYRYINGSDGRIFNAAETAAHLFGVGMKPQVEEISPSLNLPGQLVIRFLLQHKDGATKTDIIRHLRADNETGSEELCRKVETLLESGTALGFLEKTEDSRSNVKWLVREEGCRRRPRRRRRKSRCCCRPRRRKSRCRKRKRCSRRRRRKSCGCG